METEAAYVQLLRWNLQVLLLLKEFSLYHENSISNGYAMANGICLSSLVSLKRSVIYKWETWKILTFHALEAQLKLRALIFVIWIENDFPFQQSQSKPPTESFIRVYQSKYRLGNRLDDQSSILGRDSDGIFSLHHHVQTISGTHPASYPMQEHKYKCIIHTVPLLY